MSKVVVIFFFFLKERHLQNCTFCRRGNPHRAGCQLAGTNAEFIEKQHLDKADDAVSKLQ